LKRSMSLDGDPSGAFARAALAKLENALTTERKKLARSKDVQELVMKELDALIFMLSTEGVLVPIALLALGDLLLMVLYAVVLSLAAFVILWYFLRRLERAEVRRRDRIQTVEAEMVDLRKVGKRC
jgi:hypothetical protein